MSIKSRLADALLRQKLRKLDATDAGFQPTLVSGTNIKTVNGSSLLGSGNIVAGGGTPIYAQARRDAELAYTSGQLAVTFDVEGADSGSLFSLSNPTYIEIPSNGIYTISCHVPWKTSPNAVLNRAAVICKNSAPPTGSLSGTYDGNTNSTVQQSCSWTGPLVAGDKIYLYIFANGEDAVRVSTGNGACFLGVMGFAT